MNIRGQKIELRPAVAADRRKIFTWLTKSDLTSTMLGPPHYPDHPVPSWQEFCQDYSLYFFSALGDGRRRNFIIMANHEEVGTLGYDLLDKEKNRVAFDIWMRAEKYCGQGYGSDALATLCQYIESTYGITTFIISPSAMNKRAVAAYKKAGFVDIIPMSKADQEKEFGVIEYYDNIVMIKRVKTEK